MSNIQAGKGDTYRKVDPKKYGEHYDRIFGGKKRKAKRSKATLR